MDESGHLNSPERRRRQQETGGLAFALARDLRALEVNAGEHPELSTLEYLISIARMQAEQASKALQALSERAP